MKTSTRRYEVHEHCYVRGPLANICGRNHLVHSHEGGDVPHEHPQTGPSTYTIDKDDWLRRTGLRGGGRKTFTAEPKGLQLEIIAIDPSDLEFDVIIDEESCRKFIEGSRGSPTGTSHAIDRMVISHGLKPIIKAVR